MPELDEKNLAKLKKLLAVVDEETLTRKEFVDYFEKVVQLVLGIQEKQVKAINDLERTYANLLVKMDSDHSERFKTLREQVDNLFVDDQLKRMEGETKASFEKRQREMSEVINKKLREVDDRVSKLKDGSQGVQGLPGPVGPMSTEHLELMREVQVELKKVKNVLVNIPRGRSMGRAKIQIMRAVDLTSQVDGVVTTYTLPMDTVDILLVWSTQFPVILRPTTDFTFSGRTLTLTNQVGIIQSGQTLTCLVETLFYP